MLGDFDRYPLRPVLGHVLHFESQCRIAGCRSRDLLSRVGNLPAPHRDPLQSTDNLVGRGALLLSDELDLVGRPTTPM